MSTPKLARRMWWVGSFGWLLLAVAGAYWALDEIVLIAGGTPVAILLSLLLGGAFLSGLACAWFGWFSLFTDRILTESDREGGRLVLAVAATGMFLSPAALVLVLRSVGADPAPLAFASAWLAILLVLGACFGWLRRWIGGYTERAA